MIPDPKHYCWECKHLTVGRFPIRECAKGHYVTGDFRRQDETPEWGKSVEGGTTMYGCSDLTVREQPFYGDSIPKVQCPDCGHLRLLTTQSMLSRCGVTLTYISGTPCPTCTQEYKP